MFAIVRSGGKQYRVADNAELVVDRVHAEVGQHLNLETLLVGDGAELGAGAVAAEVVGHIRGDKIIIFKKKRRHNYRRKNGHRSELTVLRILPFGGAAHAGQEAPGLTRQVAPFDAEPVEVAPSDAVPALASNVSAAVQDFLAGGMDRAPASTEASHGA